MAQLPLGNYGVWVWLEARQLASAAIVDDDLVKHDLASNNQKSRDWDTSERTGEAEDQMTEIRDIEYNTRSSDRASGRFHLLGCGMAKKKSASNFNFKRAQGPKAAFRLMRHLSHSLRKPEVFAITGIVQVAAGARGHSSDRGLTVASHFPNVSQCHSDSNASVARTIARHKQDLLSTFQTMVGLPEVPDLTDIAIYQLVDSNMTRGTFSELSSVDERKQSFLVSYSLRGHDDSFPNPIYQHKEQIANLNASALINEEASEQQSGKKTKSRKKSNTKAARGDPTQLPPTTAGDSTTSHSHPQQIPDILSHVQMLTRKMDKFALDNERLTQKVDELTLDNGRLKWKVDELALDDETSTHRANELQAEVKVLQHNNVTLKGQVASLTSTVKMHEITLMAIRRHIVLDLARDKLAQRYALPLMAHRPAELVNIVSARLDKKDARLLPKDALDMIFTSNAIRDSGNTAAHQASKETLSHAGHLSNLHPKCSFGCMFDRWPARSS
ncbi:hypothetical protein BU15DRAFT_60174 [Melanogaster broomeanus]|nr:hypothetical protein BU15DRAFT_60174 [Melanogaster broomeanus]